MTRTSALQLEFVEQGRLVFIRLEGALDERSRLEERTPAFAGRKIVLNLEKVAPVTPLGVRDWVRWVEGLEAADNSLHLVRCSPAVMSQLKRVRNFCGAHGHLVSFQAPYFCAPCNVEHSENLLSSMLTVQGGPPIAMCHGCGDAMEFDDTLESYDGVMRTHSARPVDPEVSTAVNRFGDGHLATAVAALQDISAGRLSSPSRYLTPPRNGPADEEN